MRRCPVFLAAGAVVAMAALAAAPARATQLETFDALTHGDVVTSQPDHFDVSVTNLGGGPDLAVAFDTTGGNGTADADLEEPWTVGNMPADTDMGRALIIQQSGTATDGAVSDPNDEGSRPAGSLFFDFPTPITSIGFDLLDIDGSSEYDNGGGYVAFFDDDGAGMVGTYSFADFVTPGTDVYDPTIAFASNSLNRIEPITAASQNAPHFDRVEISLGGSGAVDNVAINLVPAPGTFAISIVGLGLLLLPRRRRQTASAVS